MSGKRKDINGRVLKTGENQRKDKTYMYRYTDASHRKQCVYAKTLDELREKEKRIAIELARGVSSTNNQLTVEDLLRTALKLKGNIRYETRKGYESHINILAKEEFVQRKANTIKTSDAKLFILNMQKSGYSFWTIDARFTLLKSAFNIAVEDDILFKNPFNWKLSSVINVDKGCRCALTQEEQDGFLRFIASSGCYAKYLDHVQVMLGTGLRISEFCGLTIDNIDFKNRRIYVEKQLSVQDGPVYLLTPTKSISGERYIPMSDSVYASLKRIIKKREKQSMKFPVDGRDDLLFIRNNGKPLQQENFRGYLKSMAAAYHKKTGESICVTPHILRHTFCTNMMRAGVDVKAMQYLMGHSSADVTLNVYTHTTYKDVEAAFHSKCASM